MGKLNSTIAVSFERRPVVFGNDMSTTGVLHNFYQAQDVDWSGPIALIEDLDGNMHEVIPKFMRFVDTSKQQINGMELKITVYKDSGKYYTHHIVKSDDNMDIWRPEFKQFIRDNLPAKYGSGYITVEDVDIHRTEGFHQCLYTWESLWADDIPYQKI